VLGVAGITSRGVVCCLADYSHNGSAAVIGARRLLIRHSMQVVVVAWLAAFQFGLESLKIMT
jgi:hypothetical protein